MIRIDDQDGVHPLRQPRVGCGAEHGAYVLQPFALHAAADRFDHLRLDIFGVHEAIGSHAARQANGEPSAAGAQVRDDGALGDLERVHDLIRLLPQLAIGRIE